MVDEGQAVGLFHAEEVPEGGFLFGQIVDIVVIFVDGLDAFQQSDWISELFATAFNLCEALDEPCSKLVVEVVGDCGAINRQNIH